jgi:hypothetical protein
MQYNVVVHNDCLNDRLPIIVTFSRKSFPTVEKQPLYSLTTSLLGYNCVHREKLCMFTDVKAVMDLFRFSTSPWTEKEFLWRFASSEMWHRLVYEDVNSTFLRHSVNFYLTVRRYFTNCINFRSNRRDNLKSRIENFNFLKIIFNSWKSEFYGYKCFVLCLLGTHFHWGGCNTAAQLTSLLCR